MRSGCYSDLATTKFTCDFDDFIGNRSEKLLGLLVSGGDLDLNTAPPPFRCQLERKKWIEKQEGLVGSRRSKIDSLE